MNKAIIVLLVSISLTKAVDVRSTSLAILDIDLDGAGSNEEVHLKRRDRLRVTFHDNPTTPYGW